MCAGVCSTTTSSERRSLSRDKLIVGFFAVLAAVSAIGFGLMMSRLGQDSCLTPEGQSGGSCPELASVNGDLYIVSRTPLLPSVASQVAEYGAMTESNVSELFAGPEVYSISGLDPKGVLVADAAVDTSGQGEVAPFVLLLARENRSAWPGLCDYLPTDARADQPQ